MTLREVAAASGGVFPSTSIASYERGERSISLERFYRLARVYGIPAERLLQEIVRRAEGRTPTLVARDRLDGLVSPEGDLLRGFVAEVSSLRGDPPTDVVAIRDGDLTVLATVAGRRTDAFTDAIAPAILVTT